MNNMNNLNRLNTETSNLNVEDVEEEVETIYCTQIDIAHRVLIHLIERLIYIYIYCTLS